MTAPSVRRAARALLIGVVLAMANFLPGQTARADQIVTTTDDATNAVGQPIKATAAFTVFPDRVIVRLTNQTPFLKSPEQALRGVSFRMNTHKPLTAHMGKSAATVRVISATGVRDSARPIDVPWRMSIDGNLVTIEASGLKHGLISDPPPQGKGMYVKAEAGLTDPSNNPYLCGTAVIEVVFPGTPLTYSLDEVRFSWHQIISMTTLERGISGPSSPLSDYHPEPNVPELSFPPEGPFVPGVTPPGSGPTIPGVFGPSPPETDTRDPQPPLSGGPEQPPGVPENPLGPPTSLPDPDGPSIPEPATFSLLGIGVLGLLARRRT